MLHASYLDFLKLIVSLLTLSVSVFINDFYDSRFEKNVKKPKLFLLLAILGFGIFYYFFIRVKYFALYLAFLGISFAYSAPPIRLKSRGFLGILSVVLIETIIPLLMVFNYFSVFTVSSFYFLAFYFFLNLSNIISHQIEDYSNDIRSKTKTFAVNFGIKKSEKMLLASKILALVFALPILFYLIVLPKMDWFLILCTIGYFVYKKDFYVYFTRIIYSGALPLFISAIMLLTNPVVFAVVILLEKEFIVNSARIFISFLFDSELMEIEPPY